MARVVDLEDVWRMLEACAPGYTKRASREYWTVRYNGKAYRSLPLGAHGRRHHPELEAGHVRSMLRHLGVAFGCAEAHLNLR